MVSNLIAGLTMPIFNGGALFSESRASVADRRAAAAEYVRTSIAAWREVEATISADQSFEVREAQFATIFVGIELMTIPVYVLAGMQRRDRFSNEAALKYFLLGAFSSGLLVYGFAWLVGRCPGQLLLELVMVLLGHVELHAQLADRGAQVVAPLARRLGERRIGEMLNVLDAGAVLFGLDLPVQIAGNVLELTNHVLEISDLARFLVRLEALQLESSLACLHRLIPLNSNNTYARGTTKYVPSIAFVQRRIDVNRLSRR